MPQPPLELPLDPDLPVFDLPDPASLVIPQIDLRLAIKRRHSVRSYVREPLSLEELSFLLLVHAGNKERARDTGHIPYCSLGRGAPRV